MIATVAGAAALTPASSGQPPGTAPPGCKAPSKPQRVPLAKGLSIYAAPNPVSAIPASVSVLALLENLKNAG